MAKVGVGQGANPLRGIGSDWTGINTAVLAQIWACDEKGVPISGSSDGSVVALAESFDVQGSLNWQSPFEQSGPESMKPGLTAMLQTGSLPNFVQAIIGRNSPGTTAAALTQTLDQLKGRTGLTKLNSVQVFTGMPPLKITASLYFRAFADPVKEVEDPIEQLMVWAVPKKLAAGGYLSEVITKIKDRASAGEALFPSEIPTMVGITYAGRSYAPLVIESFTDPVGSPKDKDGNRLHAKFQVSFGTLAALDAADIRSIRLLRNASLRAWSANSSANSEN